MPPLTSWLSDRLPDLVGSPLAANGGSQFDRIRRLAGVEDRPTSPVRPLAAAMMASLLVAVLVTAATQPREARADELPADTNKIESLTVEQARKLVETFPGADVTLKRSNDNVMETVFDCLPLNGLKQLNADVARVLASYRKGPLFLNGLTTLDGATAKALAEFKGQSLRLHGLNSIDAATAKTLVSMGSRWTGSLPSLVAFESPDSVAVAQALATREGGVSGKVTVGDATEAPSPQPSPRGRGRRKISAPIAIL